MLDSSISKTTINTQWKILIIDDDEDDFLIARDMLREAKGRKIDVHWVSTYEAGKQELKSDHYDAVLVDYDIGPHTGIELIREATERGYTAPLILYTGRGSYEIDLEAMQAGATLYLTKNEVTPLNLERFIRYAIERKRIERERSDILESIQDGFYSIDRNWNITFISRQAANNGGFAPADAIGRNIWDVFPNLLDTPSVRYYRVVMESQQMMKFEMQGANQGNWYTVSVYPSIEGISVYWQDITEQKQAEEKLAYQASLLDNIHDAIIANDSHQRITAWNKAAEKLYGYTAGEAIGKIHGELLRSELTFDERAALLEQITTCGEYTVETVQYTKDGRRLMIEGKIIARRDSNGTITGYVNANRDITDRKQAEAALHESVQAHQESEARLRDFLESTHNNYIALDREWRFTYANRHYGQIMGVDPQEIIGKNYWELFPHYVGSELERSYRKVMTEGVPFQYYQGGIYTEGVYEVSVYPSREGLAIFSIDRTDELRYQQQIEDERARLETVLQVLPAGVWITDASGQIVGKNEQANRIWNGDAPMVKDINRYGEYPSWDVQTGKKLEPEEYPLTAALRTGQPVQPTEHRIQRFDGSTGFVLVSAAPIKDNAGHLTGAVAINLDITERKEAEYSLRRYSEALERSEEKFALSFRSSPVAIAISSVADGRFIEVNDRYTELFGFSRDELVGHTSIELGMFPDPEDRKEIAHLFRANRGFRNYEIRLLRKNGEARDVLFSTEVIDIEGQECMLSLVIDITERKRSETALKESENKYQAVFQSAPFSIVLSRLSDGEIIDVNPAWQALFGVTKEEAVGKTSLELGTIPDPETRARGYAEMREHGHLHNFEMKFKTKAGKEFISSNNADLIEINGTRYLLSVTEDITERKQAEKALLMSEKRLRDVLQSTHDSVFVIDQDWHFQYVNQRFVEKYGEYADDFIGKSLWEIFFRYQGTILEQQYRKAMEERVPVHFEMESTYNDTFYEISVYPTEEGISVFSHDRTEERRAREALRQSEQEQRALAEALEVERAKLAAAIERLPVGVCLGDAEGNILSFNSAGLKLHDFGSEAEKLNRVENYMQEFELCFLDEKPIPFEEWPAARAMRGVFVQNEEVILHNLRNDSKRIVAYNAAPVKNSAGETVFIVYTLQDLTEYKETEAALNQSIERERARAAEMETLMDTVPAMIWISRDPRCQAMTGNRYGYEFLQMWQGANISKTAPEEELGQQPYRNFKDGREIPTEELPMQKAAATGKPANNYDFDLVFNDGNVRTVLGNVNPLFDEGGHPCGAVGVFMDITDRRDVEKQLKHYSQELERSNQALQEFAFIASHDLQEPLRKILMFGESLRRQMGDTADERALDYLERMQSAAGRMQAMVKGLLELSRVKTHGKQFAPVSLKLVTQEVVSDLEARLHATGGEVQIGALPTIEADALQMRQLFQNLIGNAIKFHKPDVSPVVQVTGITKHSRKSPSVEIRIEDNGIGFEQQYAEKIFQPFQRLHGRNEYEGTGLGLAICQRIIERHNGTIEVQSSPGKGTMFIISLPLKQA